MDCLSTSAGRNSSINPMNLCALCLSAPLREAKRQRARRRTASGNRCKAVVNGSGRGEERLRRGTSRRGAERRRAQRGRLRRRWRMREPATSQNVSCRHESPAWIAYQPHDPLSTQSISALSASPRLCVSQKRRRARRRTASGNHCKAEVGVGGERDASGGAPHAEARRGRERREGRLRR